MRKLVISVVLANLLVACASEKPKDAAATPISVAPKAVVVAHSPTSAPAPVLQLDPLNDAEKYPLLAKRSVYHSFDSSVVQDADKPTVDAHGRYLSEHANRKVRLEGNCDERGSNEYNLALGQRRANNVKKLLELSGAKAEQIESVSYGEEKPKSDDHNKVAWAQNRRTDLIYAR